MGSSKSKSEKLEREHKEASEGRARGGKRQLGRYEEIKGQQEYGRQQELRRQAALKRIRQTEFTWQGIATYLLIELTKKITDSFESHSEELERETREVQARGRKRQIRRYKEIKGQQKYERQQELRRQAALKRIRQTDFTWQGLATYLLIELTKKITDSSERNSEELEKEAREARGRKRQLGRYEENKGRHEYERQQELRRQAALKRIRQTEFTWQGLATYLLIELTKKITDSFELTSEDLERVAREAQARQQRRELKQRQQELRRQQELMRQQELWRQQELRRQAPVRVSLTIGRQTDFTWGVRQRRGFVKEIKPDPELIQSLLHSVGMGNWTEKVDDGQVYVKETLDSYSLEFQQQNNLFRKTNKVFFNVTNIEKIFNPYLFLKFKLKEKQYQRRLGYVQTMKMYHGTMKQNTAGICKTNFDWRRNGKSSGHRFGQGVSFSPYSNYSTHYGDKESFDKVMFAVDILVGGLCQGEENTVIPVGNADTSVNEKRSVYVKYEDDSFYPTYLIHYQGYQEFALQE